MSENQVGSVRVLCVAWWGRGREGGGDLLPNGDIDDDEEEQGEGGDPTADDERDGREQCLVHDLWRQGERRCRCVRKKNALAPSANTTHTHIKTALSLPGTCYLK